MAGFCMENPCLVTEYLEQKGLCPTAAADEEGITLSLDGQNRLLLSGSPLDLIALADLLVSLALSGENQGQHWHVDELTLLDKSSPIPELILLRK